VNQTVNIIYEAPANFNVSNVAPSSVITARVIVLGATSGNLQLGIQQGYSPYTVCLGGDNSLSAISGAGTVDVTLDLSTCGASAAALFTVAGYPTWVSIQVIGATSGTASPAVVLVDSLSISNSDFTTQDFAAADTVTGTTKLQPNAAWLDTSSAPSATLTWYNK
jgi:hypothetical protein